MLAALLGLAAASSSGAAPRGRDALPNAGDAALCGAEFAAESWGQRSSLFASVEEAVGSFPALSQGDLAALLLDANLPLQAVGGAAARPASVSPQPSPRRGSILHFFRNATLTLNAIEARSPRLARWSRAFAEVFGVSCRVDVSISPHGTQALSVHSDQQDLLAVQAFGEQAWKAWDVVEEGPQLLPKDSGLDVVVAPFRHTVSFAPGAPGLDAMAAPSTDAVLEPGRALYVPRGSLHVSSTAGLQTSSVHLVVGFQTQSFSYALAVFHAAAEPEVGNAILAAGWDLHRFRQEAMRLVDRKDEGVDFRRSLPLGWARWACASRGSSACGGAEAQALRADVRTKLSRLIGRVLRAAPAPPEAPPRISDATCCSIAAVFERHLLKFQDGLSQTAAVFQEPAGVDAVVLPRGLHVAYAAWGVDGYGRGVLEVRLSWCDPAAGEPLVVRWPASMLPMLQVVAASPRRRIALADFGPEADAVPKLLFAIELARLPLLFPIELSSGIHRGDALSHPDDVRDPDCSAVEQEL